MTFKGRVSGGRLLLDEPTDLPEGTEVDLWPVDPGDWLDDSERQELHKALRESVGDVAAGRVQDAGAALKALTPPE